MGKFLKFVIAAGVLLLVLVVAGGFFFVRWANRPENVEALQQWRKEDAARAAAVEAARQAALQGFAAWHQGLKPVMDENFQSGRFEFLTDSTAGDRHFKFGGNQFHYSIPSTRGLAPSNVFLFSKEDFGDFAAELDLDIWGRDSRAGIFWAASPQGSREPASYQAAYASASSLEVLTGGGESRSFGLGTFFESLTTQNIRVEHYGPILKVSVNGSLLYDGFCTVEGRGKLGLFLRNHGTNRDSQESIHIVIKRFHFWQ